MWAGWAAKGTGKETRPEAKQSKTAAEKLTNTLASAVSIFVKLFRKCTSSHLASLDHRGKQSNKALGQDKKLKNKSKGEKEEKKPIFTVIVPWNMNFKIKQHFVF